MKSLPRAVTDPLAIALIGVAAVRCSSQVTPLDSARPDAASEAGSLDLGIRVVTGLRLPAQPAAGVHVRLENAAGVVRELDTDASGAAPLQIDPADGPWNLTVARAGLTAVSIFGITGALSDPIVLQTTPTPVICETPLSGAAAFQVNGVATHMPAEAVVTTIVLDDLALQPATEEVGVRDGGSSYAGTFTVAGGAPSGVASAIAWHYEGVPIVPIAEATVRVPSPADGLEVDFDFSSAVAVSTSTFSVTFPSAGLLQGTDVQTRGGTLGAAMRFWTDSGQCRARVGDSDPVVTGSGAEMTLRSFPGEPNLTPDYVQQALYFINGPDTYVAVPFVRDFHDGATFAIDEVDALSIPATTTTLDAVTLTANAPAYDTAGFSIDATWTGYTYAGGQLTAEHLPHLPSSVHAADLGLHPTVSITPYVLRGLPGAPAPWSARYQRDAEDLEVDGPSRMVSTAGW